MARGARPPGASAGPGKARPRSEGIRGRLRHIALLTRKYERRVGDHLGVNLMDLSALDFLMSQGPRTPSDLASELEVTTAASTHIVDRLERAGHASREPDATDRRKVLVVPVPASIERVHQALAPTIARLETLIAGLSEPEMAVVERFLGQVVDFYTDELQQPLGTPTPTTPPSRSPPRRSGKDPSHG
jgi:DNA-binding MarR family transcriptional regulator